MTTITLNHGGSLNTFYAKEQIEEMAHDRHANVIIVATERDADDNLMAKFGADGTRHPVCTATILCDRCGQTGQTSWTADDLQPIYCDACLAYLGYSE